MKLVRYLMAFAFVIRFNWIDHFDIYYLNIFMGLIRVAIFKRLVRY